MRILNKRREQLISMLKQQKLNLETPKTILSPKNNTGKNEFDKPKTYSKQRTKYPSNKGKNNYQYKTKI